MYVDLAGLARYKSDFGAWARGALLPKDAAAARVRTAKAGAVSFVPVQQTPLDVSVDFLFSETSPASGDKSPDNPSTITGVSSVKVIRCGKNIVPYPFSDTTKTSGGITWTDNGDGTVTANGTATANSFFEFYSASAHVLKAGVQYTVSGCPQGGSSSTYYMRFGSGTSHDDSGSGATWTAVAVEESRTFVARIGLGTTVSNLTFKPQIEIGSTATDFEPYAGTDYSLPLGSTFYGGIVDLATGLMTVTHYSRVVSSVTASDGLVYNGTYASARVWPSNWSESFGIPRPKSNATFICDSLPTYAVNVGMERIYVGAYNEGNHTSPIGFYLDKNRLDLSGAANPSSPTVNEVKSAINSYISNNPITIVYELYTPYTVQLTPTEILSLTQPSVYDPRVNTVYGDASAVQVGYLKHPSAASSDLRNAVVSLGGGV